MYNKSFIPFLGVLTLFGIANGKSNQTNDEQRNLNYIRLKASYNLSNFQHFNATWGAENIHNWWIAPRYRAQEQWIGARKLQPMEL